MKNKNLKQKLIKAVEIIDRLVEIKCGGPGSGVPGPCPSGGGGGGSKPPKKPLAQTLDMVKPIDKGDYTERVAELGGKKTTEVEAKPGIQLPLDTVVKQFQKMKEGDRVGITKAGTPGDGNYVDGVVVARYKFNDGLPWKGVGAVDLKTSSGKVERVSAVTKFHRIARTEG